MSESTTDVWSRFEGMLAQHAPELLSSLRPPATAEQIKAAQVSMGLQLPQDVREAYLRHNGSDKELFPPFCRWASVDEVVQAYARSAAYDLNMRITCPENYEPPAEDWAIKRWNEQKVRPEGSNSRWIPIGLSNTSTVVCIDLDPAPKGAVGQLIVDHGMCEPYELASSFDQFLVFLVDRVERGILIYRDWQWIWMETDDSTFDWDLMRKQ